MKRLSSCDVGRDYRVVSIVGDALIKRRLMEMGIVPGIKVKVVGRAPLGDPIELSTKGFDLTLRLKEAENVVVEEA